MFDWLEADESDSKVTFQALDGLQASGPCAAWPQLYPPSEPQEVLRGVMTLAEPPSGKTLLQAAPGSRGGTTHTTNTKPWSPRSGGF